MWNRRAAETISQYEQAKMGYRSLKTQIYQSIHAYRKLIIEFFRFISVDGIVVGQHTVPLSESCPREKNQVCIGNRIL